MNHIEWWLQEQNIDWLLRQDNADFRLTEIGHRVGLVTEERYNRFLERKTKYWKWIRKIKKFTNNK